MTDLSEKASRASSTIYAGCLFSGMGGFATGLRRSGVQVKWASDNNHYAALAFQHRFPDVPYFEEDIRCLKAKELKSVDILAGGFPCQSFSQAGSRDGFADPRGRLFFEITRLVSEWPVKQRPKIIVLENVPFLMHGEGGKWFEEIRRSLRRAGYWFRQSSCWVGNVRDFTDSPQDRERLFLVAASKEFFSYNPFVPPVLSNTASLQPKTVFHIIDRMKQSALEDYLPTENKYYQMINAAIDVGESTENIYQLRRSHVREKKNGLCPTLAANMGTGGHNVPFVKDTWGIRKLRVCEVAELQGFDRKESLFPPDVPKAERYRLIGNAACPGLVESVVRGCLVAMEQCNA